ncbi:MAG: hypothetical protein IJA11_00095 [Oscillospiraceae bacterium]|nr:hypothetical protein [Oscillospiraceae bacterium]
MSFISSRLFPALLNMSLTGSIVILAVLVIRFFLRKAPKKWSYLLWLVVAFRLICPVSLSAPVSLLGTVAAPVTSEGTIEYIPRTAIQPQAPADFPVLPTPDATSPVPELPSASASLSLMDILPVLWLVGVIVLLIYSAVTYLHLRRRLSTAILQGDDLWQSDRVQSPFILGFFRPRIYIPFGLDEQTLGYVLAHEHYHLKRGDHIVKPLAFLLLAVHWFNPLCWLAFHLMGRDMEMSCDEQVLAQKDGDRKVYSTALLSFAANRRFPSPSPLAFGEGEVRPRIINALNWKKPKVWVTAATGVVCVVVLLLCALNPRPAVGQYASVMDFVEETLSMEKTAQYFVLDGEPIHAGGAPTATANVLGTKVNSLKKVGDLSGLAPDGVLEAWEFSYLLALDADPSQIVLAGGQYAEDEWYNLDGYFNIIALRYNDGSYDILGYEHQGGDNYDFKGERSYEEALHDWYVNKFDLTAIYPPYVVEWPAWFGTNLARRHDGKDGWCIYIPVSGWEYDGIDSWRSAYGTGAGLHVFTSTVTLEEQLQAAKAEGRTITAEGSYYRMEGVDFSTFLYASSYPYPWVVEVRWPNTPSWNTYAPTREQERQELFRMAGSLVPRKETPIPFEAPNTYDMNHNGTLETFLISHDPDSDVYSLSLREDGQEIWCDRAGTSHVGWNTIFAIKHNGLDYLLRYNPSISTGCAFYCYELFSLDEKGKEVLLNRSEIEFDVNFGGAHQSFDPKQIADFLEEVHTLLKDSRLLLSTQDFQFRSGGSGAEFNGDAFWGDSYDNSDKSLEEILRLYAEERSQVQHQT